MEVEIEPNSEQRSLQSEVASELGITYTGQMDVCVFMVCILPLQILRFTTGSEKVCFNEADAASAAQGQLKQRN